MLSGDDFRAMQTGDTITVDGRALRFVRFRGNKATCVDDATGERVNLFPTASSAETPPAPAGASTEQE